MTAMDFTNYFYGNVLGYWPNNATAMITHDTVQYLLDSHVSETQIKDTLMSCGEDKLTPHNLPNKLWTVNPRLKEDKSTGTKYEVQDNLVERDTFYLHPRLMLKSAVPKLVNGKEIVEPYYCEPICLFTIDDLIDYFCDKIRTQKTYMNTRYSVNSIFQNMKIFRNASSVLEPLDIMLFSIDYAANIGNYSFSTFMQLQQYLGIIIEDLENRMAYVRAYGYDKIVWRADKWLSQN